MAMSSVGVRRPVLHERIRNLCFLMMRLATIALTADSAKAVEKGWPAR